LPRIFVTRAVRFGQAKTNQSPQLIPWNRAAAMPTPSTHHTAPRWQRHRAMKFLCVTIEDCYLVQQYHVHRNQIYAWKKLKRIPFIRTHNLHAENSWRIPEY
jgi:hypothetical protein